MAKRDGGELESLRIDKWLWAARFFKTRAAAVEAINGGKVHLAGARVKPARGLRVGDQLSIRKGVYQFDIEVLGLNAQRRPASEAALLYAESADSRARRETLAEERRFQAQMAGSERSLRPTKKQRRQIHRFRQSDD